MFDDIYEVSRHKKNSSNHGYDHNGHNKYTGDRQISGGYDHYNPLLHLAQKILHNKMLLFALLFIIVVIGAVGAWVIIKLLPYLGQAVSMAEKQGIKGIMETITPFIQKIWEGAAK